MARNTLTGVELIQADLTCTDTLGDRRFDLITAFRFFPNAESQLRQDALTAIVRHLEPEGMLIFNNHRNRGSLIRRIVVAGRRKIRTRGQQSQWGMSRQEGYELVASAGLRVEREYSLAVLPLSDRHMLKPSGMIEVVEGCLSRIGLFAPLAQNLIFVCRRGDAEP